MRTPIAGSATGDADRAHRSAQRFFWRWLIVATVLSVADNVAHAVIAPVAPPLWWLTAAAAGVPPLVLVCATHSVAALVRTGVRGAPTGGRWR